jgi:hypothetical protein
VGKGDGTKGSLVDEMACFAGIRGKGSWEDSQAIRHEFPKIWEITQNALVRC